MHRWRNADICRRGKSCRKFSNEPSAPPAQPRCRKAQDPSLVGHWRIWKVNILLTTQIGGIEAQYVALFGRNAFSGLQSLANDPNHCSLHGRQREDHDRRACELQTVHLSPNFEGNVDAHSAVQFPRLDARFSQEHRTSHLLLHPYSLNVAESRPSEAVLT